MRLFFCLVASLCFLATARAQPTGFQPAAPLGQGHSHNDYWRPHPLFDALALGFQSVEADVFLVDSTLLVGHEAAALRPGRTLESLYLDPLRQLGAGRYARPAELWLFIDVKTDGPATYARLRRVLARYAPLLTTPLHPRPNGVRVILTGGYPRAEVLADTSRLVFLDGQLPVDLRPELAAAIPTVNADWQVHFHWTGQGPQPAAEAAQLRQWDALARRSGQRIRFWNLAAATPAQRRAVWQALLAYPSLLVGADELAELAQVVGENRAR
ncbi:hypothetical protein [Hymenobacter nivis]|uniref:Altered inheritance of mitochondria protein 6 n=1 Tax=Hymenobacter nivis TaxID=1850093 RepID=A0A502HFA9_9BACT|nr:hypothetical protein [Hymenobacter nivis]TPG71898.1 hypothetical protein EAH73_01210 [Hymenobacter nivis]